MFYEDNGDENVDEGAEAEYLTPQQLAKKCNVSIKSITNWTQARRLPAVKIGRLWRYRRVEIEKRLVAGRLLYEEK